MIFWREEKESFVSLSYVNSQWRIIIAGRWVVSPFVAKRSVRRFVGLGAFVPACQPPLDLRLPDPSIRLATHQLSLCSAPPRTGAPSHERHFSFVLLVELSPAHIFYAKDAGNLLFAGALSKLLLRRRIRLKAVLPIPEQSDLASRKTVLRAGLR
jgi:hypothetical protein